MKIKLHFQSTAQKARVWADPVFQAATAPFWILSEETETVTVLTPRER